MTANNVILQTKKLTI